MEFRFGELTVRKIFELDSIFVPLRMAFPEVSAADLQRLRSWYWNSLLQDEPEKAQQEMYLHSYVLQTGGKNILIDTCCGNQKDRSLPFFHQLNTPYMQNLHAAGLTPEAIDVVMCTHLHFDHVGWNTRLENGKWVPTFPNARYLFTRADFEYFDRNRTDPLYGPAFIDSILPILEHGQAELVETDHVLEHEIQGNVWLEGAPGHSPGSSMIHARAGATSLLFSGDTFHHPIQLACPELKFFGDDDAALACETRRAVFAKHADKGTVFFPAHFGHTSGGRVRAHEGSFRYDFLDAG